MKDKSKLKIYLLAGLVVLFVMTPLASFFLRSGAQPADGGAYDIEGMNEDNRYGLFLASFRADIMGDFVSLDRIYPMAVIQNKDDFLGKLFIVESVGGNAEAAAKAAESDAKANPSSSIPAIYLSYSDFARGDAAGAYGRLEGIRGKGDTFIVKFLESWLLMAQEKHDAALDLLESEIGSRAFEKIVVMHLALQADLAGEAEYAEELYEEAVKYQLDLLDIENVAGFYMSQGRKEKAISVVSEFHRKMPFSISTLSLLSAMEDGSYSPRPVDSVAKGLAKAYFDVSNIIMRTIPQATDLYLMYLNMASSLWPDMHIATLMRAEIYKKHEDMRTYFSLVNSIPKSSYLYPMAQMTYGSYLADRQSPKAPAIYKGLVSKYPGIPQLYQGLGDYYKREKKYKDALEYYSKGIEIGGASQTLSELHFSRGVVHDMLDNSKEAEKDLEAAVTLDHKNPVVLNYYGYYLTSRDIDAEKGFKLIERAIAADPLNPYYLDSYGWAFFKKGDIASAVQMLEYAKTLRPKNPVIADHLGDVYWSMGRRREAKFEWEKALGYIDFDAGILAHELDRSRLEYKIEYGMKE